ncbi:MAG TPA: hypothetical protein VGR37_02410 [Longimicrobiaceae bacterium]|nr:hypothetical protein [Longimicrobiaceae bacterium]
MRSHRRRLALRTSHFALAVLLAACAPKPAAAPDAPAPTPPPAASAPALRLAGQKVLVLPVQAVNGLSGEAQDRLERELLFALGDREPRATWIAPEVLERALRRSPGFAGSPRAVPGDPMMHHRERRVVEPLAGELRRYAALTDVRLVLLPRAAAWVRADGTDPGRVRISAALVDARSGDLVWWGEAEGDPRPEADTPALASAAAALAARIAAPGAQP